MDETADLKQKSAMPPSAYEQAMTRVKSSPKI